MRSASFAIFMLLASALPAAAADWSPLPAMPTARFGAGATTLGGDFYVLGGRATTELADVSVWSETAGVWTAASPMSRARQFPGAVTLGGRVYAVGGYGPGGIPITGVERFDPAANTWSAVAPLPSVRALAGVVTLNGQIYVMSGEGDLGMPQESCFRYDPGANAWSEITPVLTPRSGATAAILDGEIYLMGGAFSSALRVTEIYNPAAGWRPGPALPEALWMPTAATFEGRIWLIGGFDASFSRSDRVYSIGNDGVWRQESSMPLALAGAAAASDGMRLVVAGGMNASSQPVAAAFERMSALPPPPPPPPPAGDTLFCNVEVSPHTLNLKSFGIWLSAEIWSDAGGADAIDVGSLTLGGVAVDMSAPVSLEDGVLRVKFPRHDFRSLPDGDVTLTLEGMTTVGDAVYGEAPMRVFGGASKNPHGLPTPAMKPGRGNGPLAARTIEFRLATPMTVAIDVLDIQGRRLGRIANDTFQAGTHVVEWSGSRQAPAGVYLVRARFGKDTQFMRFAIVR